MRGRIQRALSGFYYVKCADGQLYTCKARGKFRRESISPLVGDDVEFCEVPGGEGRIDEILPRRNSFDRPSVANIDQMVIVCSQAIPKTDPYLVDRMTAIAALKGCDVLICINKCDLDPADALREYYENAGFRTVSVSAETGEGIEALRAQLVGRLSAVTGNSGVGKSSILNALAPNMSLKTGEVSQALGRGRHTTRHVELYRATLRRGDHRHTGLFLVRDDGARFGAQRKATRVLFGLFALPWRLPIRRVQPHKGKGLLGASGRKRWQDRQRAA